MFRPTFVAERQTQDDIQFEIKMTVPEAGAGAIIEAKPDPDNTNFPSTSLAVKPNNWLINNNLASGATVSYTYYLTNISNEVTPQVLTDALSDLYEDGLNEANKKQEDLSLIEIDEEQPLTFASINAFPESLNGPLQDLGIPCFVSEKLAAVIHVANLTDKSYDFGMLKIKFKKNQDIMTEITALEDFMNTHPKIKLFPINTTHPDKFLNLDLDEIELSIKKWRVDHPERVNVVPFLGDMEKLGSHKAKLIDRFKSTLNKEKVLNPPGPFSIIQYIPDDLPELIKKRLAPVKPDDLPRSIRAELATLKSGRTRNTLKGLLRKLTRIDKPISSQTRAMTDKWAGMILEYVNGQQVTDQNKKELEPAGLLAHKMLHADSKEDFADIITDINRQLITSKKHSSYHTLLLMMRNDVINHKFRGPLPLSKWNIADIKKNLKENIQNIKIRRSQADVSTSNTKGPSIDYATLIDKINMQSSDDEQRLKRLCGLSEALCESKNKQSRSIGYHMKEKYLSAKIMESNVHSASYEVQFFLTKLLEVQTKNTGLKDQLIDELSALLNNPKSIRDENYLRQEFHVILDKIIPLLKREENKVARMFNWKMLHQLRGFIEENREKISRPITIKKEELMAKPTVDNVFLKECRAHHFYENGNHDLGAFIADITRDVKINGVEYKGMEILGGEKIKNKVSQHLQIPPDEVESMINAHSQKPIHFINSLINRSILNNEENAIYPSAKHDLNDQYFIDTENNKLCRILDFPALKLQQMNANGSLSPVGELGPITFKYELKDRGNHLLYLDQVPTQEEINAQPINSYIFFKKEEVWHCGFVAHPGEMRVIEDKYLPQDLRDIFASFDACNHLEIKHNVPDPYKEANKAEVLPNTVLVVNDEFIYCKKTRLLNGSLTPEILDRIKQYNGNNDPTLLNDLSIHYKFYTPPQNREAVLQAWVEKNRYGLELVDVKTADPYLLRALEGDTFTQKEVLTYLNNGQLPAKEQSYTFKNTL